MRTLTEQLVQLLQLKTHERPSEATEGRLLYNVETRLEALDNLAEQLDDEPSSSWGFARFGFATLFAGLLTLNMVYLKKVENPQSPVAVSSFGTQQTAQITPTNNFQIQPVYNAAEQPEIMLVSSNNFPVDVGVPNGLQYINLNY